MRFVSPIFAFPTHAPWVAQHLTALHDVEQLQFALSTQLPTGGCPRCVRTCGNTQKVGHLGPNPPSSHPWGNQEPPFPSWQPACQVSVRLVLSLLRKLFHFWEEKLRFPGLRRDRETQPEGPGLWSLTERCLCNYTQNLFVNPPVTTQGKCYITETTFFLSPVKTKHDYRSFYWKVRLIQL